MNNEQVNQVLSTFNYLCLATSSITKKYQPIVVWCNLVLPYSNSKTRYSSGGGRSNGGRLLGADLPYPRAARHPAPSSRDREEARNSGYDSRPQAQVDRLIFPSFP